MECEKVGGGGGVGVREVESVRGHSTTCQVLNLLGCPLFFFFQ